MLTYSVVGSDAQFEGLRTHWDALLGRSGARTLCTTFEWARTWWTSYHDGKQLLIVDLRHYDQPVAIVPLYLRASKSAGVPYIGAHLIGDGSHDSDYLDAIVASGHEEAVAERVTALLRDGSLHCDVLFLNEVPEHSIFLGQMRRAAAAAQLQWAEAPVECTYVPLPADWNGYVRSLAPRMRTKLRSLRRNLERDHDVRFERCERHADLDERLEDLFRLHALRWQTRIQEGVFSPAKRQFYKTMAATMLDKGWLALHSLAVDGRFVAHQFCVEYLQTMHLLQEGFDPALEHLGVGNVLRSRVLEDCIERKVTTYDFLAGVTSHKLSWGGAVKKSVRATAGRRTAKARLHFAVPRITGIGKQAVKAVVPQRVLRWGRSVLR